MRTILSYDINSPHMFFNYYEKDSYIKIDKDPWHLQNILNSDEISMVWYDNHNTIFNENNIDKILKKENVLDLRSEKEKAFFFYSDGPHQLLLELFSNIIEIYEYNPKCKIYINISHNIHVTQKQTENTFDHMFYNFLIKFFNDYEIEYEFITNFSNIDYIITNKSYILNSVNNGVSNPSNKLLKYFKKYINDTDIVPNKKIYLNRKSYKNRNTFETTFDDLRILEEDVLEKYLENFGFQSISAVDEFKTFEDQINFFYETKILMSVSASGLVNSLLMQQNTTTIELVSPLLIRFPYNGKIVNTTSLHNLWQSHAPLQNSSYIALPNLTKKAYDIINFIESNDGIRCLLND